MAAGMIASTTSFYRNCAKTEAVCVAGGNHPLISYVIHFNLKTRSTRLTQQKALSGDSVS